MIATIANRRTVPGLVDYWANMKPHSEFLRYVQRDGSTSTMSWSQFQVASFVMAEYLSNAKVRKDTHVLVCLKNRPEFLIIWIACARLGAILVPVNPESSDDEIGFFISHSGATLGIFETGCDMRSLPLERVVDVESPEFVAMLSTTSYAQTSSGVAQSVDDVALMYTSGTTSRPKGVRVNHSNYIFAGETVAQHLRMTEGDRFLTVLPLFHANSQYYSVMSVLCTGASLILVDRFSASRYFDVAQRNGATISSLFAAPIRMILAQPFDEEWRRNTIRAAVFAQNLNDTELADWERRTGVRLLQLWGMTETMGPPLMNPLFGERKVHSIGRPTLGYQCQLVDAEGRPVPQGSPGELLIRGIPGVSITSGYLNDSEATRKLLADGWLHSGDLVMEGSDGFFYFVDRLKDMIKRGGENVAASEVEEVIRLHPDVGDVSVVGVPDEMLDEAIIAFVVRKQGSTIEAADVIEWCVERLAKFRVPEEVRFIEELPRTSVGKVQRNLLRDLVESG